MSGMGAGDAQDPAADSQPIGRVFVAGAGTMAPGIAAAFAVAGYPVLLWGRSADRAGGAAARARAMAGFLVENALADDRGTIGQTDQLEDAEAADVVIEAISEDLEAKRRLFERLERAAGSEALLATNTSGLLVREIGRRLDHRERLVAMHFWNPAHLMPLVEVAGDEAAPSSIDRAIQLALAIGKRPVRLERELLGFLGVRMQQAVVREAIALLERGAASAEDIDLAVRASFGIRFPVIGPLESADLSGLDVIASIHDYLLADLDGSTEPQRMLRERVAAGHIGAKAGRGFFDWTVRDPVTAIRRRDEELVRRLRLLAEEDRLSGTQRRPTRGPVTA